MSISVDTIREWLTAGEKVGATHMIIVCDTFDHEDYPVYVGKDDNVRTEAAKYDGKNMQRITEVYNFSIAIEKQLDPTIRVFNY